jgi:hypothetical protein
LRSVLACLSIITLAAPPIWSQEAGPPPLGRQLITVETLRSAGVRRLSDILALVDGWDISTINGFTWEASAWALSSFGQPTWAVMLDGQPVDLDIFGVRSLERLPVSLGQIDSVVILSAPAIRNGQFVEGGLIHIHSRRPGRGFSIQAHVATASETGDPGPYQFTDRATPNVDRVGSDVSGQVLFGGSTLSAVTGALWREHFVTNRAIRERNRDISTDKHPIIKQAAASLQAGWGMGGGRHELYLGRSIIRDYYFLKAFGREVPVESPFTQIGLRGTLPLSGVTGLRYRAAYSVNELDQHTNSLNLDFDWQLSRWRAELEAWHDRSSYRFVLGAGLAGTSAETGYLLSEDGFTTVNLYGELICRPRVTMSQSLAFHVTSADGALGVKTALAHRRRIGRRHAVEAVLSYFERIREEDSRIWYWVQRGYAFLSDNGVEALNAGELGKTRTVAGDARWMIRFNREVSARLGGYYRWFSGLSLEEQRFEFEPSSQSFSGPVRLVPNRRGQLAGGEIALSWALRELRLLLFYRFQDVVSGDQLFKRTWRTVPRHRLRITALYTPWESVSLWGMLQYRSATRWADYQEAAVQTGGAYSQYVDNAVTLDIAAQKWFWERRVRLHLLFRNVFNDAVPYHPIGTAYGLTFMVQGEVLLDGL